MLNDLIKVEDRVKYLLEKHKEVRSSDKLLWLAYNVNYNGLRDTVQSGNYATFRAWLMRNDVPVFESLSRARRKIMERHPELRPIDDKRFEEQEKVREWSRT